MRLQPPCINYPDDNEVLSLMTENFDSQPSAKSGYQLT